MSRKVFKAVGVVAGIAALVAGTIATGGALGIGAGTLFGISASTIATAAGVIGMGASLLVGKPSPKESPATRDRLHASLDPSAPRKIGYGTTALGTDVRYHAFTGTDQEFYHQIVCVASHEVESIDEIWFDSEMAWSSAGGVQGRYAGYLTVATRLVGTPANGIAIDGVWTAQCTLTGCAYLHLRFKLTGNDKKAESPFSTSIPTRVTIRGKGAKVYDPRLDTTVGGSGTQRAANQATWDFSPSGAESGRNPALLLLHYLIGYRINSKLAVGRGMPAVRFDMASFITAANMCDESVAKAAGGTESRYRADGIFSEADDPSLVIDNLCASMNAVLRDAGGKISLTVLHNDLASPIAHFDENDILGDESWQQTPPIDQSFNLVRGRYTDPSDEALYQLVDAPEVRIDSPDEIERIDSFDVATCQSPSQWQRLAKQRLQRNLYQGLYAANFGTRAWQVTLGQVVTLSHVGLGWEDKLFRVVSHGIAVSGVVPMALQEEHADIYAWDAEESPAVQAAVPTVYDPLNGPIVRTLYDGSVTYGDGTTTLNDLQPAEPGATAGAPPGTPVGTTPAEEIERTTIDTASAQRQMERDGATIGEALARAVMEANTSRTRMRDAGIHVDAATGEVRIHALDEQASRTSAVEFRMSAAEGSLLLRATTTYVNDQIALAVLDPSQIADLEDLQLRIGAAELDIDGLDASVALKASQLEVDGLSASLSQAELDIDALEGAITAKVEQAEFDALETRVSSAEVTIGDLGDVTGFRVSIRQARFVADDAAESALRALLAGDAGNRQRLAEIAQVQNELTTKIVADVSAEATARLTLAARTAANEATITNLQQVVVTPNGALAKALLLLDVNGRITSFSQTQDGSVGITKFLSDAFIVEDPVLGEVFKIVNGIIAGAQLNWSGVIGSGRPADDADVTGAQPVVQWLDLVTGRAIDSRLLNPNNNFGLRSLADFPTLTWTDNGGSCTLNISLAVFYPDWGGSITFPAGSVPGIAYGAKVYVWRNQANPATAGESWGASTNINNALGPGKVYCGYSIAPASAGAPPPPPPPKPGIPECVQTRAFVPTSAGVKRAEEVAVGDTLILLDEATMAGTETGPVEDNFASEAEAVRLVTASGIALTLSACTPITLSDGRSCRADECLGEPVPVLDHGRFRWERVAWSIPAGTIRVSHIRCFQRTYAAGDAEGRYILTHNPAKP